MTPGARVQTAIEAIDRIAAGEPAERVLTRWARGARHAGSGDRAAVRDHVFDVLRRWWSCAALGRGESGRARMIGLLRSEGIEAADLFTGEGYSPQLLSPAERDAPAVIDPIDRLDMPRWLLPEIDRSLGADRDAVLAALRMRAPVFLRANLRRTSRDEAAEALAVDDISCRPHPLSPTALEVTKNPRRIQSSRAYRDGLIELQDAASQAVVDMLPLMDCARVLDYCAGGGGKTLGMAARHRAIYHAHDVDPGRMRDLPVRAARAGAEIVVQASGALRDEMPYDLVLVDAPCSGSGSWRRAPEGKIRLTQDRLDTLRRLQAQILDEAFGHVAPGGCLAYVTCSLLACENGDQVHAFSRRSPVTLTAERRFLPLEGGDGFYCALLRSD